MQTLLLILFAFSSAAPTEATEWGTLSGKIIYTGKPVKPAQLEITRHREVCCRDKAVHLDESLLIGKQGGLKNVFVYLQKADFDQALVHPMYRNLSDTVELDIKSCTFAPRAAGLWYRFQTLTINNHDPITYVPQLFVVKNQSQCNGPVPPGGDDIISFHTTEPIPMNISGVVHPWLSANCLILDHPYFAITDETGAFQIKNIPAGKWKFQFWHEEGGYLVYEGNPRRGGKTMQIEPGDNDLGEIRVPPEEFDRRVAARELPSAGVVLTFDDRNMNQWVKQIPLFRKYNAQVTFFVDHFHTLTPQQLEALKQLKAAGHAIGCHGAKHRKAVDYVRAHGMERYLKDEIEPAVKRMTDAGLPPSCFAYPSSSRNAEIDQALLKTFRHLRGGTGLPAGQRMRDLESIYVPVDEIGSNGCLLGTGIDYAGTEKRPDYLVEIKDAMDHAKQRGEIVVFYAHNISDKGPGHHLQPRVLEAILAHAQQIGLKTLTYDDLP